MRWLLAFLLGFPLTAIQPIHAQQHAPVARGFGDWTIIELADGDCVLHQRLVLRQTRQTIADIWLQSQQGGSVVLSVQVPLGASLADLMAYRHADDPTRVVPLIWQFCNTKHCLAQAHLAASEANRLRRGHFVEIVFRPLPDSAALASVVSLSGVTRGLDAQEACSRTVPGAISGKGQP